MKRLLTTVLILALWFLRAAMPAHAQSHFTSCITAATGSDATVLVEAAIQPTINGEPMSSGDEIAVLTPSGVCAGVSTWTGSNITIKVRGEDEQNPVGGFQPGEALSYRVWDASAGREYQAVQVTYHAQFRTDGLYAPNAIYRLASLSATGSPDVPALLAPSQGAVDVARPPTLSWGAVEGASSYSLQLSTDASFASSLIDQTGITGTSYSASGLAEGTTYYWRVRAASAGGAGAFSTAYRFTTAAAAPAPPGVPVLTAPAEGASGVSTAPTLSWQAASGAASYDLQIATTQDFAAPVVNQSGLTSTSFSAGGLQAGTTYYWRVRAVNAGGNSGYSGAYRFTTVVPAPQVPGVPVLVAPVDGAGGVATSPTLTWRAVDGAGSYEVQVAIESGFTALTLKESGIPVTSYPARDLREGATYYWRVRAVVQGRPGDWSAPFQFTTFQPNRAPVLSGAIGDQTLVAGASAFTRDLTAAPAVFRDDDGDVLRFSVQSSAPAVVSASLTGFTLVLTPVAEGTATVTVSADDGSGHAVAHSFRVVVERANHAPAFTSTPATAATEGQRYSYSVTAEDPDGDTLILSGAVLPGWLHLEDGGEGQGVLSGTPSRLDVGAHQVVLRAEDGRGGQAEQRFLIAVGIKSNRPPVVNTSIGNLTGSLAGAPLTLDLAAVFLDADGDSLVYTVRSSDPGVAVASLEGYLLRIVPVGRGRAEITLTARDGAGSEVTTTFEVMVDGNRAPEAQPDSASTLEDTAVELDVLANDGDPDGDALDLSILTAPVHGIAVVRQARILYTPGANFHGQDSLRYQVSDGHGGVVEARVRVTIEPVNDAPVFPEDGLILSPADGATIAIGGTNAASEAAPLAAEWKAAEDPEGDAVQYTWQLASSPDFAQVLVSADAGAALRYEVDHGTVADLIISGGGDPGSAVELYHRVLAGDGALQSASPAQRILLVRGTATSTDEAGDLPADYVLGQNYPNPFNPQTTIEYALPAGGLVTVKVYDVQGREIATLVSAVQSAGRHAVVFDARELASGVYLYRIQAGGFSAVRRMVLLK